MAKYRSSPNQDVLSFPALVGGFPRPGGADPEADAVVSTLIESAVPVTGQADRVLNCEIVLSGSYRKGFEALKAVYEEFRDLGCTILSPTNVSIVREDDGFVYMQGEETQTPEGIEDRHLKAIQRANFVWLHAPEGYVGPTAALEVGYANAVGVPVYAQEEPTDAIVRSFVRIVESPSSVLKGRTQHPEPPAPALNAFQEYYKRAAIHRGYTKEQPKDCLLLMVEEVGELARALRKREKLVRHGSYKGSNEAHELADVFLYVVHMANVLGLDLAGIVQKKEIINVEKFLAR
jgi:NTP pyrophosphatase (non-canonical NTP hydrolase)